MKRFYFLFLFVVGSVNAQDEIINFPDANFKSILLSASPENYVAKDVNGNFVTIDVNNDSEIQENEAESIYELRVNGQDSPVSNLVGIHSFTNLKVLRCLFNPLMVFDMIGFENLEALDIRACGLTNLDVSGFTNLKELYCIDNNISSLNLTGLPNLISLACDLNQITTLDLSLLSNLKYISCTENLIIDLNVAGLTNLLNINCSQNQLTSVDISTNSNLESLFCTNNNLTVLDVNLNFSLKDLWCESNPITSLDVSDLTNLKDLRVSHCPISSIDVSTLVSLENFSADNTELESLNLSGLSQLIYLDCSNANITSLNLSGAISLININCNQNIISSLDLTEMYSLSALECKSNQLTTLNLSDQSAIVIMDVSSNSQLQSLYMKNGLIDDLQYFSFQNCPNLQYICADENEVGSITYKVIGLGYNCNVNSYCSFIPEGIFYTIDGTSTIDSNDDGCNFSDIGMPNLKFNITNGSQTGSLISNHSGQYSIPVNAGTHTIVPIIENPAFFNISPSSVNVTFPSTTSPFTQNFCITPNGVHPDLEVAVLPTTPARPGFDTDYKIILKNKGNIQQSGTVSFTYDDTVLDYIIAEPLFTTQAEGSLTWDFTNLEPFETREINVALNVNTPMETPVVNGGDVLNYIATIISDQVDDLPLDNIFALPQIVVNSFDPNDKTCLEGTSITPDMIGQYVHYMIRFENTGTFAAQNIVVKDMMDIAKFDVSSLIALNGSHPYTTRITGNKVEFIFENINLPFDDANNDGYVVFKIKTLPTLALGDSFSNSASIYFDYNFPIVTDPAVTTFAVLGMEDFEFNNYFTLYPNPTNGILNITSKQDVELQSISIYNVLGQMVVAVPNAKGISNVDVSNLSTGNYFIKVVSDKGTSNTKFIKN